MTRKSVLYALAVVVLTGSMAVAALADDYGMNAYGPEESSYSSDVGMSEANPGTVEPQLEAEGIREPVETGAVPDLPGSSSDEVCCSDSGDPTFRTGGP